MNLIPTGIGQLDRVLDGGFVFPSMTLLAGDPGTGKTTLMLMAACGLRDHLPAMSGPVLYASSNERVENLEAHARRSELSMHAVHLRCCQDFSKLKQSVDAIGPAILVIDTMHMSLERDGKVLSCAESDLLVARYAFDIAHKRRMAVVLVCGTTTRGAVLRRRVLEPLFDRMLLLRTERSDGLAWAQGVRQLSVVGKPDGVRGRFVMGSSGLVSATT